MVAKEASGTGLHFYSSMPKYRQTSPTAIDSEQAVDRLSSNELGSGSSLAKIK